jgi:hypothetical protein
MTVHPRHPYQQSASTTAITRPLVGVHNQSRMSHPSPPTPHQRAPTFGWQRHEHHPKPTTGCVGAQDSGRMCSHSTRSTTRPAGSSSPRACRTFVANPRRRGQRSSYASQLSVQLMTAERQHLWGPVAPQDGTLPGRVCNAGWPRPPYAAPGIRDVPQLAVCHMRTTTCAFAGTRMKAGGGWGPR